MRSFLAFAFALSLTWGLSGCDNPAETPKPGAPAPSEPKVETPKDKAEGAPAETPKEKMEPK